MKTNDTYQAVIGLEIHAQINVLSKIFSSAPCQVFAQEPNSCVSFVDAAFPGMLPVLNIACVEQTVRLGLALGSRINLESILARKHYFYPDNPAGYQISQYKTPLVEGGKIHIETNQGTKSIRLQRIHIEQDAGKSMHDRDPRTSCVDFNRAGVGLMEIVSHPDLSSPEEVVAYVKQLRCLMRYLGVCHGDMEKGQLRVDANVSVHIPGTPLGTRVELKNMNSLKFLQQGLHYEIERQIHALTHGETLIQETRTFNVDSGMTQSMRSKEEAEEYCYFSDPDLPHIILEADHVARLRDSLPELPWEMQERFMQVYHLPIYDVKILTEELEMAQYFEEVVQPFQDVSLYKLAANWIIGELSALCNKHGHSLTHISARHLSDLIDSIFTQKVSQLQAKEVLALMFEEGGNPLEIIREKGWEQVSDSGQIQQWVVKVLENNPQHVQEYLAGKTKLMAYFVGQVMKESQGKCNPKMIQDELMSQLGQHS